MMMKLLVKLKSPPDGGAQTLTQFINSIDNTNAVSTMGTLEFVDKISKFYTTDIICAVDDNVFNNGIISLNIAI